MIASAWKKQDKTGDQSPEKGKGDNRKKKITFFFTVKKTSMIGEVSAMIFS